MWKQKFEWIPIFALLAFSDMFDFWHWGETQISLLFVEDVLSSLAEILTAENTSNNNTVEAA